LWYYDLSLLISFKAFLPSLRVLKISQDKEEMISMERVMREMRVASILLNNLMEFLLSL
tara:strand:- start:67 stop:243 length:177 start_codon:yes stop_codon:yes gene_type:complete